MSWSSSLSIHSSGIESSSSSLSFVICALFVIILSAFSSRISACETLNATLQGFDFDNGYDFMDFVDKQTASVEEYQKRLKSNLR